MTLNPRLYIENAFNSFGSPGRDIPFSLYDRNIAFGGSACSFKKFIELISFSVLDVPNSISLKPRLLFYSLISLIVPFAIEPPSMQA